MGAEAVRDEKLKVLRSLKPINASNVEKMTVRGQYRAGASDTGAVKGYLDELEGGVSNTETYVGIKAEIANWRWAGVPFYIRRASDWPSACRKSSSLSSRSRIRSSMDRPAVSTRTS